jgi:hypothetical protein
MDVDRWGEWVTSGMLLEEPRMSGADSKLGVSCCMAYMCYIQQVL